MVCWKSENFLTVEYGKNSPLKGKMDFPGGSVAKTPMQVRELDPTCHN